MIKKMVVFVVLMMGVTVLGCLPTQKQVKKVEEPPKEFRWVSAENGLSVRNAPSAVGEKIGVVLFGTKLLVISEDENVLTIAGREGQWTEVSWEDNQGWVFGGFLSDEEVVKE